jgi:hypothetical protein
MIKIAQQKDQMAAVIDPTRPARQPARSIAEGMGFSHTNFLANNIPRIALNRAAGTITGQTNTGQTNRESVEARSITNAKGRIIGPGSRIRFTATYHTMVSKTAMIPPMRPDAR